MYFPAPGDIIEDLHGQKTNRVYYTFAQNYKATNLADTLNKLMAGGAPLDALTVLVALADKRLELLDTTYNKKASVRYIKPGENQ